jgi:hypothetical protein
MSIAVLLVRVPREAVLELRVVDDRLRRVARARSGSSARRRAEPLRAALRAEDVAELALELAVVARVIGVLRARPLLEQVERPTHAQKFFQNACSDAMNSTWPSLAS